MKGTVLFQKRKRRGQRVDATPNPEKSWLIVTVGGGALATAGWTDALLLWFPLDFGNAEWEFATTSTFFDAVPLGTIGLLALVAGSLNRTARPVLLALSAALPLLTVFFVAAAGLFFLTAIQAWSDVQPTFRPVLERIVVKTSILSLTYIPLYTWLAWTVVRSDKKHQ